MTSLHRLNIAITRPREYAKGLQDHLTEHGAKVMLAPTLVLQPQHFSIDERLMQADSLIFISQAAVHAFFQQIKESSSHQEPNLSTIKIFAVGQKTAEALAGYGINAIYPKAGFDSERLLALAALNINNVRATNIVIVRGGAGREYLAKTLKERRASVSYLDVYQRRMPESLPADFIQALRENSIDVVIVTSVAGMLNLYRLLSHYQCQPQFQLCTTSERISQVAREKKLSIQPLTANSTTPEGIAKVLMQGEKSE